jgi:hypothetical protein
MNREDWSEERYRTAQIAGFMCEGCKKSHPVPFSEHGQAHHRLGRGGGRRDDRALVPMQTLESEPNLARWRWFRNTQWTCQIGHELLEKKSTKEYRHSLMKFCECGLLSVDKL